MKKAFIVLCSGILMISSVTFISCGGNADKEAIKTDTVATATPAVPEPNPMAQEGLELISKSDCLACHKVNEAATGPAYSAVAARYAGNQAGQDSLVNKIIKGGSGNWGAIVMPGHPTLAPEDVKKMVAYVMSLKS